MILNSIIPNNSDAWSVGKFLFFKKYQKIPVAYVDSGLVYVFLDGRIYKQVIQVVNQLRKQQIEFYFTTPEMSNPKGVDDYKNKVIYHYLYSYCQQHFYDSFRKINFDLIENLVTWTEKENCFDLLKPNHEKIIKVVEKEVYDFYSNKIYWDYPEIIREEIRTLYREIVINRIL